jgi:hypothetical protein
MSENYTKINDKISSLANPNTSENTFTIAKSVIVKNQEGIKKNVRETNKTNPLLSYLKKLDIGNRDTKFVLGIVRTDLKNGIKKKSIVFADRVSTFFKYKIFNSLSHLTYMAKRRDYRGILSVVRGFINFLAPRWAALSVISFIIFTAGFVFYPNNLRPHLSNKYSIYSSKPLVLGDADAALYAKDARSQRINEVYKDYNCPLEGLGEILVMEADKNGIPWWVVAAISFQESSCGKLTPEVNGIESYNAWGWGVWGDNIYIFDNWVRGIEQVSEYLDEQFYSKGIDDLCEIMRTYTPPSKGSWCEGVKHFGDEILEYKTPQD